MPHVVPNEYRCPISKQIMADPVILAGDGHTYEREQIVKWLLSSDKSPVTGAKINNKDLVENILARTQIRDFLDKNHELFNTDEVYFPQDTLLIGIKENDIKKVTEMFRVDPRLLTACLDEVAGYTAFQFIAEKGSYEMLKSLVKDLSMHSIERVLLVAMPRNWQPKNLHELFINSIEEGNLEFTRKTVMLGADVNTRHAVHGNTALHLAVKHKKNDILDYLLTQKIDINAECCDGSTPLGFSAWYDNCYAAERLLNDKAEINRRNLHGNTALHNALQRNAKDVAILLLKAGANTSIKNKKQEKASMTGSDEIQLWFAEERQRYKQIQADSTMVEIKSLQQNIVALTDCLELLKNQTNILVEQSQLSNQLIISLQTRLEQAEQVIDKAKNETVNGEAVESIVNPPGAQLFFKP